MPYAVHSRCSIATLYHGVAACLTALCDARFSVMSDDGDNSLDSGNAVCMIGGCLPPLDISSNSAFDEGDAKRDLLSACCLAMQVFESSCQTPGF